MYHLFVKVSLKTMDIISEFSYDSVCSSAEFIIYRLGQISYLIELFCYEVYIRVLVPIYNFLVFCKNKVVQFWINYVQPVLKAIWNFLIKVKNILVNFLEWCWSKFLNFLKMTWQKICDISLIVWDQIVIVA